MPHHCAASIFHSLYPYTSHPASISKLIYVVAVSTLILMWCLCSLMVQVARIQVQIQDMLSRRHSQHPSAQAAIAQLDSELMDITKVIRLELQPWPKNGYPYQRLPSCMSAIMRICHVVVTFPIYLLSIYSGTKHIPHYALSLLRHCNPVERQCFH